MTEEQKDQPTPAPRDVVKDQEPARDGSAEVTDDPVIKKLRDRFPDAVLEQQPSDWQTLSITRDHILDVCRFLRDDPQAQFDFLTDVTGRHLPDEEKQFQVIYHLYSFPRNVRLRLKVDLAETESVPSVMEVWAGANWMEREVYDLLGIQFENHPDLRRLLLPEDWEGHPLRKEYPLEFRYNRWTEEHLNMVIFDPEGEYTGTFE